ncbi:hypothetical protein CRV00_10800 [Malaciobacter molluscorum]|uniref:hypothetical protein n=1 Tax=Malaciobacter molluscorum TaxID=1032072 RepID=UPI00100B57CB|nr:hypothetical protein [Malaciobacter molluscorum]RXJ93564.1 hypothetical protein CRV00_10800 [Malaciobacter molluscorum]
MSFINILYLLINIVILFFAIYFIIFNSKKRRLYKDSAKELSQNPNYRECTQKEKELLKKYYYINIKDEKVHSTDCVFLYPLEEDHTSSNSKFVPKRFNFNGAILICGLFFSYFYKNSKIKTFEYIVYKNNVYLVSVLFEDDNILHDLNMEDELQKKYDIDFGLVEEGKYILTGTKASLQSLLSTIVFLILLNFIDIKIDAILYVISLILIYYSFLKDKTKTFVEYKKHNLTIAIFTFINIALLLISFYDYNVMKAAIYSTFSKERTINFQKDIDTKPLEIAQKVYLSGYRLCDDYNCKKFTVLNKDLIFKKDFLIDHFFTNEDKIFFKKVKEKIDILSGSFVAYYKIDYKSVITYLNKFKKYNLESLNDFENIIKKIVKNEEFSLLLSKSKDFNKYKNAFYRFRNDLLRFESNRLRKMQKEYIDKKAKTFFVILDRQKNNSLERKYYQNDYEMMILNYNQSKRMNNIEGIIVDIKKQNGKEYAYIQTSVAKEFLIGNIIILLIIILNLLIFCFNLFIYIFTKKKKRAI